ncbi:MAG: transglutaminase family protein [Spirochaetaceae bacterium]|nr:transglutaminase family protein [Spirochaetaceae bacterium]
MKKIFSILMVAAFLFAIIGCSKKEAAKSEEDRVTFEFELNTDAGGKEAKEAKLYVPYPRTERQQDISDVVISGNYDKYEIKEDAESGAAYVYAQWADIGKIADAPKMTFAFNVDSHFTKGAPLKTGKEQIPDDIKKYLQASRYIPCDDAALVANAEEAVGNSKTMLEKARAVYEWTVANTYRNASIVGCGLGQPLVTLNEDGGGGKCADISSVFVAVLRAAGIPAREVYGLRIAGKDGEITGDFHCWSEFYLPDTGWVQADPADVRKAMLVENLQLDDPKTGEWKEFFWNGDNLYRIIVSRADKGLRFDPPQSGEALDYFMYPFAQVDGTTLNYFDNKNFVYTVTYQKGKKE